MSFKPIDAKRDEYRKYLERTGVMEALSKVFIKLFECQDKPENAIDFIRVNMGDAMQEADTIEHLKRELEDARNEIAQLKRTLETVKADKSKPSAVEEITEELKSTTINDVQPTEIEPETETKEDTTANNTSDNDNKEIAAEEQNSEHLPQTTDIKADTEVNNQEQEVEKVDTSIKESEPITEAK